MVSSLSCPDKNDAVVIENLSRTFGELRAVDDISFSIPRGQVTGFVGANGAGKTTTMRILATLDTPTHGSAQVMGYDVVEESNKVRSLLGWMPDNYGSYENTTVIDYLDFFARAQGIRDKERIARVRDVMEFTELSPIADRLIDKLSKGMGQRLCLGRALIHDPEVLILDEPAAGLDPKARVELKHLIRILAQDGKSIFISSHILSELEEMCDSLLLINQGRIVHYGSAEELKRSSKESLLVHVDIAGDTGSLQSWAEMTPHVEFVESTKHGGQIALDSAEDDVLADTLRRMIESGLRVTEFKRIERRLEDAFVDILSDLSQSDSPEPPPLPNNPNSPVSGRDSL
ncbi:MAG: ABC transporter ATP-binding protein [Verrucomicrobiota bacterium]